MARRRGVAVALFATSVIATLSMAVTPAAAVDQVWTGIVDGNFTTGGNWVSGTAPSGNTDNALFDPTAVGGTSNNSTVNTSININSILLQNGYSGLVTNPATSTVNVRDVDFGIERSFRTAAR